MPEIANAIPPEAWPFIDKLFLITLIVVGVWLALSLFVWVRRRASNLTPVQSASVNKKAQPDFLKVDEKAREAAMSRGEDFDKELARRDREAEKTAKRTVASKSLRIAGVASFLMSLFTMASIIYGSIFQVARMGTMMREYGSLERIVAIIERHPVAFAVAVFVIVYQIYRFIAHRKWQGA